MREKQVCRHCEKVQFRGLRAGEGRKPFAVQGAIPHYAPDLPFRLEHLALDVQVDPVRKKLSGQVTQKIRTIAPGQKLIRMDQIGLQIEKITVAEKKAAFTVEGNRLLIHLDSAPEPEQVFELSIKYSVENPKRGLYFTGPDADYPKKPHQVWSQGQDEDNRYWFPTFDYPNQKATSEIIATVPKGYTAVSNGALLSKTDLGANTRFHYRLGTPHVTYLITLAVAEFSAWEDRGPRGLPVQYFVAPGLEENGKRAFGNTPRMIEAYEAKTGMPYPYEKYSQVAVQDFIFGGMENTSATTQTDLTLHDARAHLDFSSDPLVSHELAHQWFGDLLTCRDWSQGWLNEGFATFMERVWIEADTQTYGDSGQAFEEAKYYSYMDLKEYLEDDQNHYRRPIVCNTYIEPIDLFDTHLYQKGGLVLNCLRGVLGPELFWKSISLYVSRHRGQSVETLDLIRAIEDATGRNMRRFFDEWVFGAGYPELELSYSWHEEKKLVELTLEQKQTGGAPYLDRDGARTHLFHIPMSIEITLEGGQKIVHQIELSGARDRLFLSAGSKPLMVRVDRDHWIPKTLKFPRPKELLLYQLKNDRDCMGRIEAIKELAKIADAEVFKALAHAVVSDAFWGVQVEAAQALASTRTDQACDSLIQALTTLDQKNVKARRGVVRALSTFKGEKVSSALKKVADHDVSYFVEADAITGYATARTQFTARSSQAKETEKFLLAKLSEESYRELIRVGAIKGLAELPGIGSGDAPEALAALVEWTVRGKPQDARGAAVEQLGRIARTASDPVRAKIFAVLSQLAQEDNFRLRLSMIRALGATESSEAIALLQMIRQLDLDGRVRRTALSVADDLQLSRGTPESVVQLKAALDKLEEDYRKLKSWVEEQKAASGSQARL